MKRQITTMMTGAILAMSATTLPAFAQESPSHFDTLSPAMQEKLRSLVISEVGKWSINETLIARFTPSERAPFDKFKAGIKQGLSPIQAAKKVGNIKVTRLDSTDPLYQKGMYVISLSLSPKTSATLQVYTAFNYIKFFKVDTNAKLVTSNPYKLLQR